MPNERFGDFYWLIVIQILILLLLRACFFAGVQPWSLGTSLFVFAPLFTNHLSIFYANGCLWLLTGRACAVCFLHAGCLRSGWMTDEWIYGKLLATDLHESAWLTDNNALGHPLFIATLAIMFRPQVCFLSFFLSWRQSRTKDVWSLECHSWSPGQKLYIDYKWKYTHISQAPPPPQRWPFRSLTWHFDKLVEVLFKQVWKFLPKMF